MINGTQFSTAYAISGLLRAHGLACATLVTGALSVDAAMASTAPFRSEIQQLRGHAGQIDHGVQPGVDVPGKVVGCLAGRCDPVDPGQRRF